MNNYRPSFLSSLPPVVKNILAINIIMFLATAVLPPVLARFGVNLDLNDILGMHYWESSKFNPAQLLTYAFMHADFFHILFNMFGVFMFGRILEYVWGPKRFLIFYVVTALGAAIVQQVVWTFEFHSLVVAMKEAAASGLPTALLPFEGKLREMFPFGDLNNFNAAALTDLKNQFLNSPEFVTIGASGAVFGLLLAFGWLFPKEKLFLMFIPIPIPARIFVVLYGLFELFNGVAASAGDHVAHFAHLGGMLFGIVLILIWKKQHRLY